MNFRNNRITQLFGIKTPIIQGGMVWNSGWRLASAVSNAGGLGLIGSGSMYPEMLQNQIAKCQAATILPFGVNLPLIYPSVEKHIEIILGSSVPIIFTSAGNPKTWTPQLKSAGITVCHVVSSVKFALKAADAGVDAIVCEGFEAGGHNGIDETTTMCLIPAVRQEMPSFPILAAGGIATGHSMLAAMILGADGVQMGSRFAASEESSAHPNFKQAIVNAKEGSTMLALKSLIPVRLLKNQFYEEISQLEKSGAPPEALQSLLGKGRAKKGMLEGNLKEGELEIGQIAALISEVAPVQLIFNKILEEFNAAVTDISEKYRPDTEVS